MTVFLKWPVLYSKPISKETQRNQFICSRFYLYCVFPSVFYILPLLLLLFFLVHHHLHLFAFFYDLIIFIQHVCVFHLLQYRYFPLTLHRLIQHVFNKIIIIHSNNNFNGVNPSYFFKILISFKTFIFSNVLCIFLFSFSYALFFFVNISLPLLSNFLAFISVCLSSKKPKNGSTISGATATPVTLQTSFMLARYQYRFRQTLLPTNDMSDVQYEHPCRRRIGDDVSRYCSSLLSRRTFPAPPDRFQVQPYSATHERTHSPVLHRTSL